MRRREFITLITGAIVTRPFAATAQQVGRIYRLGVLLPHPRDVPVNLAFWTNFDGAVSLKAKTSRSSGAHIGNTLI
jgi:hypothetical protein